MARSIARAVRGAGGTVRSQQQIRAMVQTTVPLALRSLIAHGSKCGVRVIDAATVGHDGGEVLG